MVNLDDKNFSKLFSQVEFLITEMKDIKLGVDFLNEGFENFKKELKDMREHQKKLKEDNEKLHEKVSKLEIEIEEIKVNSEVEDRKRNTESLEISGIPEKEGENLEHIITVIAKKTKTIIPANKIKQVFRRRSKKADRPGDIVVKFAETETRNELLKAIRINKLTTLDLGFKGTRTKVYGKELLTTYGKDLYYRALERKRTQGWKFLWIKDGKVFVRKTEGEPCYWVKSKTVLNRIQ